MRLIFLVASFLAIGAAAAATKPIRFWNLAMQTVTSLQLAKTGTQNFGPDLCKSDKDGSVEHDERLNLPDVAPGTYDVRVGYADGRKCTVKNLTLQAGKIFSIEDKDLTACTK
ncbi:MAG: hypothetical protein WCF20_03020 [Methylovirgula sp.]